ncbi:uncharacterized protein LOC125199322 [Salvia hispanica]|uniref:uncharacterized protein LOC125199322 n=1 Tax=Salvia hispanica TaxID=49212 RepID=UPI002009B264|nr:uncharacterized protein LOC125199322 [Salvia hispanica]
MGDRTDIEKLQEMVKLLMDERDAERAAREAMEKKNRETLPVMNMFNHGNMITFPNGPRIDANNFELRMPLIQRVEQTPFAGRATEDANRHLSKFVEIANTLKLNGVDDDAIRVRLFPFSLIDSAKEWFECMPPEKVSTWKDIVATFLDKYYPPGTILKLKSEIFQFTQGHDEPLYEAFARFKALLRKCPNHGFSIDHQVGILYNGFNEKICAMLDSGANGGFLRKTGEDAMAVIEEFATNSRGWSKERHATRRVAAIEEAEESSFAKELAELRVRIDQMDISRKEDPIPATSIVAVNAPETAISTVEEINYVQGGGPRNYNNNYRPNQGGGNFNNYNGNRPHPNLSYSNNNYLQPPAGFNVSKGGVVEPMKKEDKYEQGITKILEVITQDRKINDTKIGVVEARINNLEQGMNTISAAVTNITTQMEQIQKKLDEDRAKAAARVDDINKKWVAKQKSGDCPVAGGPPQTPQRPATETAESTTQDCPVAGGPPHTPQRPATDKAESSTKQELVRHNGIVLPFQPKRKFKLEEQFKQFLNMFCKVHTNIPLVESLQEIPKYAKLLREAVMRKKKPTKADLKLPHHCSEIIQKERAVKQRDPGQFIIRCRIGEGKVDKALCDLGSSINLMPLKYYEKLNIGPLKSSDVTLRLADNSSIKTVGMIEDVLVKVDDFIFPADFIVLDMKVDKNVPLILGRDFLATCKALIDVGRGEITISDNHGQSTYKIESEMLKFEEAKRAKMEQQCRAVMATDLTKSKDPFEAEDPSTSTIYIVKEVRHSSKKGDANSSTSAPQKKKQKRKKTPKEDPEIYVIKTKEGKYKWWKKLGTKLLPMPIFNTRVIDPPN